MFPPTEEEVGNVPSNGQSPQNGRLSFGWMPHSSYGKVSAETPVVMVWLCAGIWSSVSVTWAAPPVSPGAYELPAPTTNRSRRSGVAMPSTVWPSHNAQLGGIVAVVPCHIMIMPISDGILSVPAPCEDMTRSPSTVGASVHGPTASLSTARMPSIAWSPVVRNAYE